MARARPDQRGHKRPSAANKLRNALAVLLDGEPGVAGRRNATAAALCRIAGVSRNSLYRYHPTVVQRLRQYQQQHPVAKAHARSRSDPLKTEVAHLRDQLSKLVTLVDHYYGAYCETRTILQRRERELADLRRKLDSKPAVLARA
jgi:AcrR family transcriptional regulator